MRVLLDTHVLLWWLANDRRLSAAAGQIIADPENTILVSAASAWEISIKKNLGKLRAPEGLPKVLAQNDLLELPITVVHAERAGALPRHHEDPFDRMLIAQAEVEGVPVLTADSQFQRYGVTCLPA